MEVNEDAFVNGIISVLKRELLNNKEISAITTATSFNEILKVLNRTTYSKISSKLEKDIISIENSFNNYVFKLIKHIIKFSSYKVRLLLTSFYNMWYGFYNAISDLKNINPLFPFETSLEIAPNSRELFMNRASLILKTIKDRRIFNNNELQLIKEFIDFRKNNTSLNIDFLSNDVISELINFLYLKEKEINFILTSFRKVLW